MKQFYKILFFTIFFILNSNTIFAAPVPTKAKIEITSTTVCQNQSASVTFSLTNGEENYNNPITYTYTLTGVTVDQTAVSPNNTDVVSINVNTSIPGTYTYTLVGAMNASNPTIPISGNNDTVTIIVKPKPVIDFSFTNNQCSGSAIQFNSDVSGAGPSYSYSWNFGGTGGGNTSNDADPTHTFNNTNGNSSQSYNVSLTVTSNGCSATITKVVTIQNPDPSLLSNFNSETLNGFPLFKKCSSNASSITLYNTSTTTSTNSSYNIDWGDNSAIYSTNSNWTEVTHTYAVGLWNLTYSITSSSGCSITKIYKVFVGSNPAVGLANLGNSEGCSGSTYQFGISTTTNNPPGTIYTISFNDNTPSLIFSHPPPTTFNHTFDISSCNYTSTIGSSVSLNSFNVSIEASNPCGTTPAGVSSIRITEPADANFTVPQQIVCINNQICLTNSSTGGQTPTSTLCNPPKLAWKISPSTGFTLASGTLGNYFSNEVFSGGSASICPIFTVAGTYTITLYTGGDLLCSVDSISKTICV